MFNRNLFENIDYLLLAVVVVTLGFSVVMVSSATGGYYSSFAQRQTVWGIIGIAGMFVVASIDYSKLTSFVKIFYLFNLLILTLVLVIGTESKGAQSWIRIGGVGVQPAEFAKLIIILTLSYHLDQKGSLGRWKDLIGPLVHVGVPILLILKQPDLGTALVFIGILFGLLFVAGLRYKHLAALIGMGMAALPVFWHSLQDYQKKRILTFIDPSLDPLGAGYNVIQSKVAIGSGMIFGKGLFSGTQNQLNFLPEQHTDFIFSVIGEELGLIGAGTVLLLYFIIIYRGIKIAIDAKDRFGTFLAMGVVFLYLFHVIINIGGAMGVMPLTGIPLPLMSYGGSSILTNMAAIGMLQSVHVRRKELMF